MNGQSRNNEPHKIILMTYNILKYSYAFFAIAAGLDKFMNSLTIWEKYLSPHIPAMLNLSSLHVMYLAGIIEIAAGLLLLTKYTRQAAWLITAWIGVIIVNLLMHGGYADIIVRDAMIAVGSTVLALLSSQYGHFKNENNR